MVGRIVNRVITGPELCRNRAYVRSAVMFAETVVICSQVLIQLPVVMRPYVVLVQLVQILLIESEMPKGGKLGALDPAGRQEGECCVHQALSTEMYQRTRRDRSQSG